MFGYVSGAFTGGKKNGKPGLFEFAENGTVFLGETALLTHETVIDGFLGESIDQITNGEKMCL